MTDDFVRSLEALSPDDRELLAEAVEDLLDEL
jgi:hypothetical protein